MWVGLAYSHSQYLINRKALKDEIIIVCACYYYVKYQIRALI